MERQSIWFLNNPLLFQEENYEDVQGQTENVCDEQSSSSSSSSGSSSQDTISSKESISFGGIEQKEDIIVELPVEVSKVKVEQEKRPKKLRFVDYLRDMEGKYKKEGRRLLTGYNINKIKGFNKQNLSFESMEKTDENKSLKQLEESFSSSSQKDKAKRQKKILLTSQFRRKSCSCNDCGGISKFGLKVQDIFRAHSQQIKAIQLARRKQQERNSKKLLNPFLDLPGMNALVYSSNGRRGTRTQTNIRKSIRKRSFPGIRVPHMALKTIAKEFNPRRGAETPIKMSRNSIEDKIIDIDVDKQHYVIKIFTPGDTDKQLKENEKKEILTKERELLSPVRLLKKRKMEAQKAKEKEKEKARPKHKSHTEAHHIMPSIIDEPFSPIKAGFITTLTKLETTKREGNRPKVLVKMVTSPSSDRSHTDFTSQKSLTKQESLRSDEIVSFVNSPIQKEQWKHVIQTSPKFKSTFVPKIEEEIKQSELNNRIVHNESHNTATLQVKKIYSSHKISLSKLKIPISYESHPKFQSQVQQRCETEPISSGNRMNSPLSLANSKIFFYKKDAENLNDEIVSPRTPYDIGNSPYLRKGVNRKGAKSFAIRRGPEKLSIDLGKVKSQYKESPTIHQDYNSKTSRIPKLSIDTKTIIHDQSGSSSARTVIKNNLSLKFPNKNRNENTAQIPKK